MMQYLFPLIVSFMIVILIVPIVKNFASQIGFVDQPSQRKIHAAPIPLMGGVAIYIGCVVSILIFNQLSPLSLAVITGGTILLAVGLLDDWFKTKGIEFPVWPRLITYIFVSAVPLFYGLEIVGISNIQTQGMLFFPAWLVWVSTMAWVFGITNMINFMDGVDGLASGIVTISSSTLLVTAIWKHEAGSAMMAAILVGACLAFLTFNFHPAKIFMGDAGAIFIGYTLAVIAIDGAFKSATFVSILVPFLAIAVPILDTVIVFSRRFIEKKGLHRADKLHTHHSLMKWGLSQTQTVSFLYLIGALFSLISIIVVITAS
ncbi:MraY family glycosyltransferase [Paenibacillus eucommiae]|uniref:UDP-GlcNAc:undecaprenyl-phosphate GlcNAc-1-phosphate transferase n=1 Tax=Paenibacillus eucommiae TaxID=1355755 RepID=A0ABS4J2X9_9BACL|nr:MraY family glycosyltransferase [Paenibacillus eucommiae]MBP1994187.1 UDP-GlcNAc:undecaprenyl-phosphate GlcNAc-1-phosphate transferase [Paenibacillus eucommiae]